MTVISFDDELRLEALLPENIVWYIPQKQYAWIGGINPLTIFTHKSYPFICHLENILGIELDSKILGQCGYKEFNTKYFYRDFDNQRLIINLSEGLFTLSFDGVEYPIDYLHQLQNLQFKLTGIKSRPNLY